MKAIGAHHAHTSVHNGIMPLRPAGRVGVLLREGGLKAMCLHVGLIHEVDAILIAQLVPVLTDAHKKRWVGFDTG